MSLVVLTDDKGNSYYFDVTYKEMHSYENQITQNPVQEGAAINDHVYRQPILFTWDVGMSDCLTSISPGQFSSSEKRSVAAFEVLESLWENATPITITTGFRQYNNMIIKLFIPYKDKHTMYGMRANVTFQQIIVTYATDIPVKDSADAQTTNQTNTSSKSTTPSTDTRKIVIPLFSVRNATYNGKTMSIEDYFSKYSSSKGSNDTNFFAGLFGSQFYNYTITPVIPASITSATTFQIGADKLSYAQLLKKYGK